LVSFVAIFISCLAVSSPKQASNYVWTYFLNAETGWPDGVVFLTGLVNPNYMFAGIDGAIHLAEDCINAKTAVPHALFATLMIGFFTSFVFAIAMLYSIADYDAVLTTITGVPIFEIWRQATKSDGAATFFLILLISIALFALNGCMESASRLTWSFARDDALVGSNIIGKIHRKLRVPVYALLFNAFIVFVIGCVYLGSTTAFNALIGVGLVLQQLCFAIPVALLMFRGRPKEHRLASNQGRTGYLATFDLGMFGWVANGITVVWSILCLVVYDLPLTKKPTGLSMNYTCAVLAGMAIFAAANWFGYARKHYKGPAIDVAHFVDIVKE
jgi:choline transport protein